MNAGSLNENIDIFRRFLASSKVNISVIVLTGSWCDKTANKNFILNFLLNYYSIHQVEKHIKMRKTLELYLV